MALLTWCNTTFSRDVYPRLGYFQRLALQGMRP
jgi:hypothetical protein